LPSWPERKALLLPLGDEGFMRGAAQHVTSLKLTQRATQKYVTSLLAERGEARGAGDGAAGDGAGVSVS
jgi:hypothetical protein